MIVSMLSWGSWANTMKLVPRWPFQLYYWDYVIGVILISLIAGLTLGSLDSRADSFLVNLHSAGVHQWGYALAAGAVFNIADLLLVATISIAALAAGFPIGLAVDLLVGGGLNY